MSSPPLLASPSSFLPSLPAPRFVAPFHAKIGSLGVLHPSSTRICGWRSGRRKGIVVKVREEEEDAFAMRSSRMDVEAEIYEFMRRSAKPMNFPTRDELIAAGRADLAETVAAQGGWLTFGWDLDDGGEEVNDGSDLISGVAQEDGGVYQERVLNGSLVTNPATALGCEDRSAVPSFSGRSLETENVKDGGVEGILSRLEKERSLSLALASRGKVVNGRDSWRNAGFDNGDTKMSFIFLLILIIDFYYRGSSMSLYVCHIVQWHRTKHEIISFINSYAVLVAHKLAVLGNERETSI
ncbi:unnamed protein product [Musa textilis]